jgi:hypothetical protein
MNFRHDFHTATELCDGKVLVVGPAQDAPGEQRNAELYDPVAKTWTSVGPMKFPHDHHTATLIPAGCGSSSCQVLIAGGGSAQVETYQVDTGQWRAEKSMNFIRSWHTATPVVDGCRRRGDGRVRPVRFRGHGGGVEPRHGTLDRDDTAQRGPLGPLVVARGAKPGPPTVQGAFRFEARDRAGHSVHDTHARMTGPRASAIHNLLKAK